MHRSADIYAQVVAAQDDGCIRPAMQGVDQFGAVGFRRVAALARALQCAWIPVEVQVRPRTRGAHARGRYTRALPASA